MALVMNLLGLIIVLGLCWMAMMWLSRGFHGVPKAERGLFSDNPEPDMTYPAIPDAAIRELDSSALLPSEPRDLPMTTGTDSPCQHCEGVGAKTSSGRLRPCPECLGTGVLS